MDFFIHVSKNTDLPNFHRKPVGDLQTCQKSFRVKTKKYEILMTLRIEEVFPEIENFLAYIH